MRGTRRTRYGDLSTNKDYVQQVRTAAALALAPGSGFARDHDHTIGLGIQRAGLGTGFGFHRFFDHEFRGAFFLDHTQRAIAVRAKCLHRPRIERGTVAAAGEWQRGDDFAIDCIEDHTSGRAAASAATHREKNVVLGVDGQAGRLFALLTEIEMAGHFEGFGVDYGDVVRVGYVEIEMPLAVGSTLLDGGIGAVRADG